MNSEQCISLHESVVDCSPISFSDTVQLSLWSGSHTPAASSENEPPKDGSPTCECGKGTLDCLIHPNTPDKWIASMRDSLARTLASLESRQEYLREPDQVFTEKSCVLLASLNRDTCTWRTLQQSFLTDSELFSQTWPRWGMTQGGYAYAHPMSERRITETGGFYLPTPTSSQRGDCPSERRRHSPSLVSAHWMWPTPTVTTGAQVAWNKTPGQTGGTSLAGAVKYWPTPTTNDAKNSTLPESQRFRDGMAGALMREGIQAGGKLYPDWVSWRMNFPIGFATTHDIVGFNSKDSKHANAKERSADSALCKLWESVGKEAIQFTPGGLYSIQEKEILRSGLHGESHDSGRCDIGRFEESFHEVSSEEMQRLWDAGEFACSSHGQQPGEQCTREFEDTLRFMPCEMALGKREGLVEANEEMQILRQTSEEERSMQHPCKSDVPTREPVNGSWWDTEPNIGRVAVGVKNRVGQLKGYGNAQVPLQAAVAWKLLGGE